MHPKQAMNPDGTNTEDCHCYMPSEEEIAEAARKIREEGYTGHDGHSRKTPVFHPPWSAAEYERRKVIKHAPAEIHTIRIERSGRVNSIVALTMVD